MRSVLNFLKTTLIGGLIIVLPVWVSVLLLLKSVGAAAVVVHPISEQLPEQARHPQLLAIGLLLVACFGAGLLIRTAVGRRVQQVLEGSVLRRVPGYTVLRGMAEQLDKSHHGATFASALVEIEEALTPGFIVERHADGRFTVFIPSAPTPAVGSIYIIRGDRVHEVDVPLVKTAACVTKWGSGCAELLAKLPSPPVAERKSTL